MMQKRGRVWRVGKWAGVGASVALVIGMAVSCARGGGVRYHVYSSKLGASFCDGSIHCWYISGMPDGQNEFQVSFPHPHEHAFYLSVPVERGFAEGLWSSSSEVHVAHVPPAVALFCVCGATVIMWCGDWRTALLALVILANLGSLATWLLSCVYHVSYRRPDGFAVELRNGTVTTIIPPNEWHDPQYVVFPRSPFGLTASKLKNNWAGLWPGNSTDGLDSVRRLRDLAWRCGFVLPRVCRRPDDPDTPKVPRTLAAPTEPILRRSIFDGFHETRRAREAKPGAGVPDLCCTGLILPVWPASLALLIGARVVQRKRRRARRRSRGECEKCGYSLKLNVSGKCPECGVEIDAKQVSA